MTDEIERVREACEAAQREVWGEEGVVTDEYVAALAKRLQPKPTPAPKVWSVSDEAAWMFHLKSKAASLSSRYDSEVVVAALNAIVDDILRDRPDAVAKEWGRRYRKAYPRDGNHSVAAMRRALFPEVEG